MSSISEKLENWLNEILTAEESPLARENENAGLDYNNEDKFGDSSGQRRIWYFPDDEIYEEYLSGIANRPERQVRRIIQRLLIPSGSVGVDQITLDAYFYIREMSDLNDAEKEFRRKWLESDYVRRVVRYFLHLTDDPPWEGITWVLNLLPNHPRSALAVIGAYITANPQMTDNMVYALGDAEGIIRARYIGLPESSGDRLDILKKITWREFEQLVEHLYAAKGYKTELTRATRDGGRDVIIELSGPAMQERTLISCKQSSRVIGVSAVRELDSVANRERANKGVVVTNSNFSRAVREEFRNDSRIELVNGRELIVLLNEYLGWTWPARIEYYTHERPFRSGE